jgi:hypothetical protein
VSINDTHPSIDAIRVAAYLRMNANQKLEIVWALNRTVSAGAEIDWSEKERPLPDRSGLSVVMRE